MPTHSTYTPCKIQLQKKELTMRFRLQLLALLMLTLMLLPILHGMYLTAWIRLMRVTAESV